MMRRRMLSVVALAAGVVGCDGGVAGPLLDKMEPAEIHTAEDMHPWTGASAPRMYTLALTVAGSLQDRADACPSKVVDGNTTTWTGGCTDEEGANWLGTLTDVRDAPGSATGTTTYDGFGTLTKSDECDGQFSVRSIATGKVTVAGTATEANFDLDLKIEGNSISEDCVLTDRIVALDYAGSVKGAVPNGKNSAQGPSTWNGKGRMGETLQGAVSAETVDEVIDLNKCLTEALSGSTKITAGHHVAVITYDGATDCAETSSAKWTLDGEAKGELQGVGCSAAGGLSAWGLLALGGLALRRRRSN